MAFHMKLAGWNFNFNDNPTCVYRLSQLSNTYKLTSKYIQIFIQTYTHTYEYMHNKYNFIIYLYIGWQSTDLLCTVAFNIIMSSWRIELFKPKELPITNDTNYIN